MKTLKFIAIGFMLIASFSCKKEQNNTEVVTINTTETTTKKEISENATLAKVKFNVEGMTCAVGCAAKIEKSLNNMEGIKTATVDFETKTAIVEYDVAQVNTDVLTKRVIANGDYKAVNFNTLQ